MSICGETEAASPATTLVHVPKEVLGVVGAFADPLGVFGCLAKATRDTRDLACQTLARARYPAWALPERLPPTSVGGYSSWRELIVDDNARAGMWCLDVGATARINPPGMTPLGGGIHFATRVARVARDPNNRGQLVVIMEERGPCWLNDLGNEHTSSWGPCFHILVNNAANGNGIHMAYTHYDDGEICKKIQAHDREQSAHEYLLRTECHVVCRLCFPSVADACQGIGYSGMGLATGWDQGDSIGFEYHCPLGEYPRVTLFLERGNFKTWEAAFRGPGLPPGATKRTFVPRPLPNADVAIQKWRLPRTILASHRKGEWGV